MSRNDRNWSMADVSAKRVTRRVGDEPGPYTAYEELVTRGSFAGHRETRRGGTGAA